MLHLLIKILCSRQTVAIKIDVIFLLNKMLTTMPWWLFGKDLSLVRELSGALTILLTTDSSELRKKALHFFYSLFVINFNHKENLTIMSSVFQLAISNTPLDNFTASKNLFHCFKIIKMMKEKSKSSLPKTFHYEFESCRIICLKILSSLTKIQYYNIIGFQIPIIKTICHILDESYGCVDVRFLWLKNLLCSLNTENLLVSKAMCKLHIAVLCIECQNLAGNNLIFKPDTWKQFKSISPNLIGEVPNENDFINNYHESVLNISNDEILNIILSAGDDFKNSKCTLLAYKVYSQLNNLYFDCAKYDKFNQLNLKMKECLSFINNNDYGTSTYFKIVFFGHFFESLGEKNEYIFHFPRIITLSEFLEILTNTWSKVLKNSILNIIGSSHEIKKEELNYNENHIQVTNVEPYFDHLYIDNYTTYEKNYNINKFFYRASFIKDKSNKLIKAQTQDLSLQNQYSQLTIVETKECFPYMSPYLPITGKKEILQTPIEVSINDLSTRNKNLLKICIMKTPNLVLLEGLLQGCVSTSVNQGPLAIAETFLNKNETQSILSEELKVCDNFNSDQTEILNKLKLISVFKISEIGLEVFRKHAKSTQIDLYEHMKSTFFQLKEKLSNYLFL